MQLKIVDRSGKQLADIRLTKHHPRLHDLHLAFTKHIPKYTPSRQLFTLNTSGKPVRLGDAGKPLADYGVKDGDQLIFKDLGPQIGWQTVFIIEYLGPLVLHPLLYWNWSEVFGGLPIFQSARRVSANSTVQLLILAMVIVHFAKRELETLLVHRFSHGTMPLSNLFKNCFHYWILSGVLLAWEIYSPQFAAETAGETLSSWHYSLVAVWIWAQLSNLSTHLTLCNLRPAGTKVRKIPFGYGFDWPFNLSCPNYFFETVGWLVVVILTHYSWTSLLFFITATGQMLLWAFKKHRQYHEEFGNRYPRRRRAMFPMIA